MLLSPVPSNVPLFSAGKKVKPGNYPATEEKKITNGIYDEDSGVETRGRFIIDPDGVIQGFEVLTPPVGRNVSETIRQIKAYQLVRASNGTEATPSGWKPGKQTLKPSPDLVGNVWQTWKVSEAFDD